MLMKQRYLLPLFLGLGLSTNSCKTHQDFLTPHPPQLFHDLMQRSKPNGYGLPVGELHTMHQNYLLHARAGIRADKKNYLEILVYDPATQSGILFQDGVYEIGPLDGTPDSITLRTPLTHQPARIHSPDRYIPGYMDARQLVTAALAQEQHKRTPENLDSNGETTTMIDMTIDRFLSTTPIPRKKP